MWSTRKPDRTVAGLLLPKILSHSIIKPQPKGMNSEELRARQRKRVKQRYYSTLHSLSRSRQLVLQLTDQHRMLVEQHETAEGHSDSRDIALRQYTDGTALTNQLRQEKQRLLELIQERELLQDRLMTLLCELKRDQTDSQEISTVPLISFRPLTVPECELITRSTFSEIQRFMARESYVSTNASVLGWRDKREIVDGAIRMNLEKTLDSLTPFDLALRTWQLLQGKPDLADLFSPSLGVTIRCLQVVNDTNVIMLNHFAIADGTNSIRAVYLASFIKIDDGYAVLFQSIDRAQFEVKTSVESEGQWLDIHISYLFRTNEAMDNKTHAHIGGKMAGTSAQVLRAWMLELLLICLRWENCVVGARTLVWSE